MSKPTCSFCGKTESEVGRVATTPAAAICDECLTLCNDIFAEEADQEERLGETSPAEEERGRPRDREPRLACTVCQKSQDEVRKLIAGPPPFFVCDECVARLAE